MNTVLITGANRGIGLELTRYYCQQQVEVYACYRQDAEQLQQMTTEFPQLKLIQLDVSDFAQIQQLKQQLSTLKLDLLINNAGQYGPRHQFGDSDQDTIQQWQQLFTVNTMAPLLLTEALLPNLAAAPHSKVICISSKMGSISDNQSGGSYQYRSSKAALNAVVKSLAHDLAGQQISVAAIHPGWVKTRMGGPNALIDTDQSITGISQVIAQLTPAQTGQFFNYDGNTIAW